MLKIILFSITILVFIVSCIWAYKEPDYESIIAAFLSLSALIGFGIDAYKNSRGVHKQNQVSGKNSKNYQAGGDININ